MFSIVSFAPATPTRRTSAAPVLACISFARSWRATTARSRSRAGKARAARSACDCRCGNHSCVPARAWAAAPPWILVPRVCLEAFTQHFGCLGDHHECIGVDAIDQRLQEAFFRLRHDAEEHGASLVRVAALRLDD